MILLGHADQPNKVKGRLILYTHMDEKTKKQLGVTGV
jgi:hypothetical protein